MDKSRSYGTIKDSLRSPTSVYLTGGSNECHYRKIQAPANACGPDLKHEAGEQLSRPGASIAHLPQIPFHSHRAEATQAVKYSLEGWQT